MTFWDDLVFLVERAWARLRRVGRRLSVYWEPGAGMVGVYVAERAVYVCPVPMLVFRWWRQPVPMQTVLSWGQRDD